MDLKLGDVAPSTVLSKFMENGEWDFHHVEGLKHNSLFDKRAEEIEIRILSNSIFLFHHIIKVKGNGYARQTTPVRKMVNVNQVNRRPDFM